MVTFASQHRLPGFLHVGVIQFSPVCELDSLIKEMLHTPTQASSSTRVFVQRIVRNRAVVMVAVVSDESLEIPLPRQHPQPVAACRRQNGWARSSLAFYDYQRWAPLR